MITDVADLSLCSFAVLEWCPEAKMIIPNHCLRDERMVPAHPTGNP